MCNVVQQASVSNIQEFVAPIRQLYADAAIFVTMQVALWRIRIAIESDRHPICEVKRPGIEEIDAILGNSTWPTIG